MSDNTGATPPPPGDETRAVPGVHSPAPGLPSTGHVPADPGATRAMPTSGQTPPSGTPAGPPAQHFIPAPELDRPEPTARAPQRPQAFAAPGELPPARADDRLDRGLKIAIIVVLAAIVALGAFLIGRNGGSSSPGPAPGIDSGDTTTTSSSTTTSTTVASSTSTSSTSTTSTTSTTTAPETTTPTTEAPAPSTTEATPTTAPVTSAPST